MFFLEWGRKSCNFAAIIGKCVFAFRGTFWTVWRFWEAIITE